MANATVTVLEADGVTETDVQVLDVGRQAAAASKSVAASTEDKAVLDAIAASLSVMDDWDSSDQCKVVVNAALPAGTNAIGKLSANSGVDIGDVDVLTINGVAPAFGDGAKGSTVLRTTLATDSPGIITVGTAGSASSQVLSVQGIASMTPVLATLSGTNNIATVSAVTAISNALPAGTNNVGHVGGVEYELVAASQSTQTLGATGGTGDYLSHVLIIPETTAAGTVAIKDGSNTAINIFVTGTLTNLVPFVVPIGAKSTSGAWQITTGANVHAIGFGDFT